MPTPVPVKTCRKLSSHSYMPNVIDGSVVILLLILSYWSFVADNENNVTVVYRK